MTPNFALVAHATKGDANKLAPRSFGDGLPKRGLAHTWRADEAHDRAFELLRALLHSKILDDPLLDLFKPVVIVIEDLLGAGQVFFHA